MLPLQQVTRLFSFISASQKTLHPVMVHGWTLELSKEWDVLGPFPINAREQHFLSPSFPLDLSTPYQHHSNKKWSSAYADGGEIGWSKFNATDDGHVLVSFPQIRWNALRATDGWAALQHHNVLRTTLKIIPPSPRDNSLHTPHVAVSLIRGSFFTLIPSRIPLNGTFTPEWYPGNIYEIPHPPKQLLDPSYLSLTEPTIYNLFVSGDYEIRLFGDPLVAGHPEPVLDIQISITLEQHDSPVVLDPALDVVCDFVDGWAFGTALGVGLRVTSEYWDVLEVTTSQNFSLSLLYKQRLAPLQSRIVPVKLTHAAGPFHGNTLTLDIKLLSAGGSKTIIVTTSLKIHHRSLWGAGHYEALRATYFLAGTPTLYRALPPLRPNDPSPRPPILALHGAGVDIEGSFWPAALIRQAHSWIVCPTGRTSWGFDWHGPSADDAWGSLAALTHLLATGTRWMAWIIREETKVVIIGHSNGGQGAWHMAARYPDRVLAAVPAAAYIKAQQYIPLSLSRGSHFVDPSLRAILDASLTPDDNDLFLSNVVDIRIMAIHGGNDENVPTWHSRELVGLVKSWRETADVSLFEDTGKPHWYPGVFTTPCVQDFLSSVLDSENSTFLPSAHDKSFTLTVAMASDSGSMYGFKILELEVPGRLARLYVTETGGLATVRATNVYTFSIDLDGRGRNLSVDGIEVSLDHIQGSTARIQRTENSWEILSSPRPIRPSGPLSQIMRSSSPLLIIAPARDQHAVSICTRIAHVMMLYFRLDTEIITDVEALNKGSHITKDIIVVGSNNVFGSTVLRDRPGPIVPIKNGFVVHGKQIDESSLGVLFLHPHPTITESAILFLLGSDSSGLERAARLILPIRTGITLPEFILVGGKADAFGAGGLLGAGFWARNWGWSDIMGWID